MDKEMIKQEVYKTFGKESYRGYANEQCDVIANYVYSKVKHLNKQLAEKEKELSEVKDVFKIEGELKLIDKYGQPEYIRDSRGCLVSFPKITKYEGQEERYLKEIKESYLLANIIIKAIEKQKLTQPINNQ